MNILRKIRIAAALFFFAGITLLLLDLTGSLHAWLGWMARVQLLPAILALNAVVVAALVVLTLLFGRVYCSVVCPLGVMQDVISRAAGKRKRYRFGYSPAKSVLRYTVLALFLAALVGGIGSLATFIAPYSAYGRIVTHLFAPVWQWGNNLLAAAAERFDSYAFYRVDIWVRSGIVLTTAAATLAAVGWLAWRGGRTWCNTICPVGTVLGVLARFSLLKPRIDTSKCNGCKLCARNCKAACIDPEAHTIDYSRCVVCMDCIDTCRHGAITYSLRRKAQAEEAPASASRRRFLAVTGLLAASAVRAQEKKVDGGLAVIEKKRVPVRTTPLTPPGSLSASHMAQHCTACQLCVAACPNGVLRPSSRLETLMQPEMSFERGFCRPECVKCSEVCPAGAIRPIDVAEKSATQIGHAVWIRENCLAAREGVNCNSCARHCPAGAIRLVHTDAEDPESPRIPVVDTERCIGCGACEAHCPARPLSAIYVEGHTVQRTV